MSCNSKSCDIIWGRLDKFHVDVVRFKWWNFHVCVHISKRMLYFIDDDICALLHIKTIRCDKRRINPFVSVENCKNDWLYLSKQSIEFKCSRITWKKKEIKFELLRHSGGHTNALKFSIQCMAFLFVFLFISNRHKKQTQNAIADHS